MLKVSMGRYQREEHSFYLAFFFFLTFLSPSACMGRGLPCPTGGGGRAGSPPSPLEPREPLWALMSMFFVRWGLFKY